MGKPVDDQNEYQFHDVTVSIFDVHTAIDAILSGSAVCFQDAFSFLAHPDRYRGVFDARLPLRTDNLEFLPLGRKTIRTSKFWSEYVLIGQDEETDSWALQLPFVAHPDARLSLVDTPNGVDASVRCVVYLNALGWSTNIAIRLRGAMFADQIVDILARLKNRPETAPFFMSGRAATLTDVFRFFEGRLLCEVYSTGRPPCPRMHYPRRFVTSLNAYTGPAKCYEAMSNGEKGLFRGILHGRNYTAAQEFEAQCKKPRRLRRITIREYGDQSANFGLADWDRGLLLFLQREARIPQSPRELRAILCHAENCRTMLATMESMRSFLNLYSLQRERTSLGEGLRLSVNRILQKLPWRYQNQVCQFYSRERPLSTSLQTGSPGLNAEPPVVGAAHLAQDVRAHGSTAASPAHRYDAFISYRHQEPDRSFARDLVWKLEADGYKIAFDERDFQASASFLEEMERCIKESRLTLAVVSPQYIGSGNCTEEAIICKVLDMSQRRRRLVPLVRERVEMPVWMYDIVGISFIDPNPFVPPFEKLKATLGTPLGNNRVG